MVVQSRMTSTQREFDDEMILRACDLARNSDLTRDLNPHVGAVVADADGNLIGQGWHQGSGSDHAEVVALREAGDRAKGATVYSTLEPCASTGKRGPCTQALIDAGVARVVFGQRDPNSAMSGGARILEDAGISVTGDVQSAACASLNTSWTFAHTNGRPWVIWKTATSLDGFIAAEDGTSQWITSDESREKVQEIRARVGAIVTGTGTALADDPLLTVRAHANAEQPLRVIVGTRDLPNNLKLFSTEPPAISLKLDLSEALSTLWSDHGIHQVLLEAGPGLSNAAWSQDIVDEVYWFIAPVMLGSGRSVTGPIGIQTLAQARRFPEYQLNRVGLDLVMHFTTRQDQ